MTNANNQNVLYFEAPTMRELHAAMLDWQRENQKRYLSLSIQYDDGFFCCIALTNPSEVTITSPDGRHHAVVDGNGRLEVSTF